MAERLPDGWERLDPAPLLALWAEHYGVSPEVFAELAFYRRRPEGADTEDPQAGSLWARSATVPVPSAPVPETLGLRVRRGDKPDTQVSNAFARRYFAGATRHVVHLEDPDEVRGYFETTDLSRHVPSDGDGYYLVLSPWGVLGRARAHNGRLSGEPSKNERVPPVL
ncbi:MAG: hypothetical protein EP329_22305 [Deltaproteobacteria bacterium]|nr:MAG: hypothetical protein EP329_22305 [Deltaproteobacteria bacterium]